MKRVAMISPIIFLLICLMFNNAHAENCDNDSCLDLCKHFHLNGTCNAAGRCQCSYGDSCSTMLNTCDLECKVFHLEGECDENDQCQCTAKPEWCRASECDESCRDDPRAKECIIVKAVGCIEYGPITFCQCACYRKTDQWWNPFKHWKTTWKSGLGKKYEYEVVLA